MLYTNLNTRLKALAREGSDMKKLSSLVESFCDALLKHLRPIGVVTPMAAGLIDKIITAM